MKTILSRLVFLISVLGFALWGCGDHRATDTEISQITEEFEAEEIGPDLSASGKEADRTIFGTLPSLPTDTARRFIRTAQLKFRVAELPTAIHAIEEIARRQGGFVENSDLYNSVVSQEIVPVSADSIVETTTCRLSCAMTLRIPTDRLDTVLSDIARHIEFPDYRKVRVQDATLDLLEQRLAGDRYRKYASELKRQARKDSSADPLFDRAEQADRAALQRMKLEDRIRFGTITLEIYQREQIRRETLPDKENIRTYKPGFWSQAVDSLASGFRGLQTVILLLLRIWWLLAAGIITLLIVRYRKHRRNDNSQKR